MATNFPNSPTLNQVYTLGTRTWTWSGQFWQATSTTVGYVGSTGYTGSTGVVGYAGSVGYTGSIGYTGSTGAIGSLGYTGSKGIDGTVGYNGSTGYVGSKGESSYTNASTPPVSPAVGDRWFDSSLGLEFVWTNDGDSTQWVEIAASGFVGGTGYTGSSGGGGGITGVYDIATTSTGYLAISIGTTVQRPSVPAAGAMRVNSDTNYVEIYYNSIWFNLTYISVTAATGGSTVLTSGNYKIHTFLSSGNFTVTAAPLGSVVECLVVAGGGSGGPYTNTRGAGGGAGGLIYISEFTVSAGTYAVTVGGGGPSASGTTTSNGSNSILTGNGRTLTALGGGAGGYNDNTNNGQTGGSGGGIAYRLAYQISIPSGSSLQLIDKGNFVYLTEDKSMIVTSGTASAIEFVTSYETIS